MASETATLAGETFSNPLEPGALNATVGGASSSVMVAVTCWAPDSVPLITLDISTTIVSSTSSNVSCTAVRLIVPVTLPGGITIEVADGR